MTVVWRPYRSLADIVKTVHCSTDSMNYVANSPAPSCLKQYLAWFRLILNDLFNKLIWNWVKCFINEWLTWPLAISRHFLSICATFVTRLSQACSPRIMTSSKTVFSRLHFTLERTYKSQEHFIIVVIIMCFSKCVFVWMLEHDVTCSFT